MLLQADGKFMHWGLLLVVVCGFCLSVGTAQAQTVAPASKGDWERVVTAAKKEGKLALLASAGDVYREVWDVFQKKYGIAIEVFGVMSGTQWLLRLDAERQAGQFLWDVATHSPQSLYLLKPRGWLEPIRPALILPEVLDDNKWLGGFARGFTDRDRSYVYAFVYEIQANVHVNRTEIPEAALSRIDQLWDPKWAGKIVMNDPLFPSAGNQVAATWLAAKGEEKLRAFVRDQRPIFSRDNRQLGEWAVRGRYPIGVPVVPSVLARFVEQGLNIEHLKPLVDDDPASFRLSYGNGGIALLNRAPHPNASKVFINWLLSQEGQTIYAERTSYNVRRKDVRIVALDRAADPKKTYVDTTNEENLPLRDKAAEILKEMIR